MADDNNKHRMKITAYKFTFKNKNGKRPKASVMKKISEKNYTAPCGGDKTAGKDCKCIPAEKSCETFIKDTLNYVCWRMKKNTLRFIRIITGYYSDSSKNSAIELKRSILSGIDKTSRVKLLCEIKEVIEKKKSEDRRKIMLHLKNLIKINPLIKSRMIVLLKAGCVLILIFLLMRMYTGL
ncbi:MAG TPA: hypothetical protein PLB12_11675 [Candidatus Goldiibacteriota bacterium]|nr:hypothetical protein [Candidatus Goldiibacteriota bacterium]